MINAVGRDIPDELLVNGKEVYQGKNYMDGKYLHKAAPTTRRYEKPQESKILASITEALKACGAKDGMTFSFHHHLRDGDYVVNMVMKAAIEELGLKDLTIAATSLGDAHDPIADYIEQGKVIGIQTSGIGCLDQFPCVHGPSPHLAGMRQLRLVPLPRPGGEALREDLVDEIDILDHLEVEHAHTDRIRAVVEGVGEALARMDRAREPVTGLEKPLRAPVFLHELPHPLVEEVPPNRHAQKRVESISHVHFAYSSSTNSIAD